MQIIINIIAETDEEALKELALLTERLGKRMEADEFGMDQIIIETQKSNLYVNNR